MRLGKVKRCQERQAIEQEGWKKEPEFGKREIPRTCSVE
jgi:hypothetical protein